MQRNRFASVRYCLLLAAVTLILPAIARATCPDPGNCSTEF